ncbi:D-alanine--D-alanine ligase [Candidatus Campbellbacteria bacterium CG11_big_fil_rev_8_21_14_0_20_44_21]|nr:MAG: D-alanine--D-alanine ligase [Candidatus Campbellbacteria bacterium CG11_big_fil_rev_8_21_14_0_20_44_21]
MIRVGILRGGLSNEFEVSLKTGRSVLDNLPAVFSAKDILIDKKGNWFLEGRQISLKTLASKVDVFFNCLHGAYGEDGKIQQVLDSLGLSYTGSGAYGSSVAMNKFLAKKTFALNDFNVPEHEVAGVSDDLNKKLKEIFQTRLLPVIVKPVKSGSSLGVSLAYGFDDLQKAFAKAFEHFPEIMVEEYIRGKEATCGVLEDFRGEKLYALPVIEIVKPKSSVFFDYEAKYGGKSEEIVPGRFSSEEKKEIQRLSKLSHQVLGLRHYSRSDFIVSPKKIYILETNTLPGLTPESLYPKSLEAVGSNLREFTEHLVNLALKKK